jgi:hypothetical protein
MLTGATTALNRERISGRNSTCAGKPATPPRHPVTGQFTKGSAYFT